MAENDQAQEKQRNQQRRWRLRRMGKFFFKRNVRFASSTAALFVLTALGLFSADILGGWAQLFSFSHPEELLTAKIKNAWKGYQLLLTAAAFFGIPCFIFVVGMQAFVGNGLSISSKAIGFKFEKLNLIKGLGRIFSIKGLVELIKSVAKVVLLTSCVVIFLWYFLPDIIYLSRKLKWAGNTTGLYYLLFGIYTIRDWIGRLHLEPSCLSSKATNDQAGYQRRISKSEGS